MKCASHVSTKAKRGSPNPLLGDRRPNRISMNCGGLTHGMFSSCSASKMKSQAAEERKAWVRELEVATITYFRVSGLEGLGSPIISGVGSG